MSDLKLIDAVAHVTGEDAREILTFSPFLDPSGMLGFLNLASPERVGFLDGKEAFHRRADCVRATAG